MKQLNYITQLVHRTKQGEISAMKGLYEQFSKEMLTASFRITQNIKDSEDIIQESFLTAFEKINSLREPHLFGGWLKKIVVNKSLTLSKKRAYFEEINHFMEVLEEEDENWFEDIPFEKLREEIHNLPDGCRQIFTLYLIENYKHREIAEALGISISNSKSQYQYALKILRSKLSRYLV